MRKKYLTDIYQLHAKSQSTSQYVTHRLRFKTFCVWPYHGDLQISAHKASVASVAGSKPGFQALLQETGILQVLRALRETLCEIKKCLLHVPTPCLLVCHVILLCIHCYTMISNFASNVFCHVLQCFGSHVEGFI